MRFLSLVFIALIAFNCSKSLPKRQNLIDFIPENTNFIVKINDYEGLKSSLENNDIIQQFTKSNNSIAYKTLIANLALFNPDSEVLICFLNTDSLHYTLITKYKDQLFKNDSLNLLLNQLKDNAPYSISSFKTKQNTVYSILADSIFVASNSKTPLYTLQKSTKLNLDLIKYYHTTGSSKSASIIYKANNGILKTILPFYTLPIKTFSSYYALDVDIAQNEIYLNGITQANDSINALIDVFKNTGALANEMQHITPSNADGFVSYAYTFPDIFKSNLMAYKHNDTLFKNSNLFDNIIEFGTLYYQNKQAVVLNASDIIATNEALIAEQDVLETYNNVSIFNFSKPQLFNSTLSPFISCKNADKYIKLDAYFVFSEDIEVLKSVITNYQSNTTLGTLNAYQQAAKQLAETSNILAVYRQPMLSELISKNLEHSHNYNLNLYPISMVQFVYDRDFAFINGILKKTNEPAKSNSITEELNIKLEHPILNHPQFVKNHLTGEKEIVVQDSKFNLYLISNHGKIIWKYPLTGPILGAIEQIDIFKNNKLQLAFVTPNQFYVLDRNGKVVEPFTKQFKDTITQPLAVFDYGKNKNYRFVVTQNNALLMYNQKGEIVSGFEFKKTELPIITTPKHFSIDNKDYIVLKTAHKLYFLDRKGQQRIPFKTTDSLSNQPVYLYNDSFITTTSKGALLNISTQGQIATTDLGLNELHYLVASTKTLITLTGNTLNINQKEIELEIGNYTKPQLFYINDTQYISVTNLQTEKIYLYNSKGELLTNFPVYGKSEIDLSNIDTDKTLEFVTKDGENSVLLYQIN